MDLGVRTGSERHPALWEPRDLHVSESVYCNWVQQRLSYGIGRACI